MQSKNQVTPTQVQLELKLGCDDNSKSGKGSKSGNGSESGDGIKSYSGLEKKISVFSI